MSESAMRSNVIRWLKSLDAVAVENPAYPGTPDVNYVEGWIELKQLDRWPPRGGIVAIEHFTPQQRVWLIRRAQKSRNIWLLLQTGRDWLLFSGQIAAEFVGLVNKEQLLYLAQKVWLGGINEEEFKGEIKNGAIAGRKTIPSSKEDGAKPGFTGQKI